MPSLPPVRIVLVDDDDSFRESLGLNLVDEGFDVLTFSAGEPALDYFRRGGEADVILLDWRMPVMNGLEVLRHLRRTGTTTPVIFLTALSDDIYEEAALEGGAIDFIDKSRRLSILLKRLTVTGSALRARPIAEKAAIAAGVRREIWPLLAQGKAKPVIYRTFPLAEAAAAHRLMESSEHIGKIVLTI